MQDRNEFKHESGLSNVNKLFHYRKNSHRFKKIILEICFSCSHFHEMHFNTFSYVLCSLPLSLSLFLFLWNSDAELLRHN